METSPLWPDWTVGAAYEPLLQAEPSVFAWEWLRRSDGYRAACSSPAEGEGRPSSLRRASDWGLHILEDPAAAAPDAQPLWRSDAFAGVLSASADRRCQTAEDFFDPCLCSARVGSMRDSSGEHLVLTDGWRSIRIDVTQGTLLAGPAYLKFQLCGLRPLERWSLVLRQLHALWTTGCMRAPLHPPLGRARRHVLLLRACDGLRAGASQREVAECLLSPAAGSARWREHSPYLRSQAQRLVRAARHWPERYRELLG